MNSKEVSRSKLRERRRRARKRKRMIRIMMFMLILVLGTATGILLLNNKSKEQNKNLDDSNQTALKQEDNTGTLAKEEEKPAVIELGDEQIHQGDLILVNSDYPYDFNANQSVPLVELVKEQTFPYHVDEEGMKLSRDILGKLEQMIQACDEAMGTNYTGITSGYRTKEYQQSVYDDYVNTRGEEYARTYVANPGYSEHHTGLAFDLGIYYDSGLPGTFSESENAVWMDANSYKYGFIRRYQEHKREITKINNEAWHFRYVGIPHATYMKEQDLCLEEYIDYLHTSTSAKNPLRLETQEGTYEVYYTNERTIQEPKGEYVVSGDNNGGYIITTRR